MPLVDSNDAALWDGGPGSLYRAGDGTGFFAQNRGIFLGEDVLDLVFALNSIGVQVGQRIALIGAGFGWVAEELVALGYGPMADGTANGKICAVDTSTWIQTNKGANANVSVINADVNAATGRRTIRQQFGSNNAEVHWVISEDVLPILAGVGDVPGGNNEIVPFCQNLRSLASTGVAHWLSAGKRRFDDPNTWAGDPRLNWKTAEAWKAWVSPDFVIVRNEGSRVL